MCNAPENEMGYGSCTKFCLDHVQWELALIHNLNYHSDTF